MHSNRPDHSSATAGPAPGQYSQYIPNHNTYGGGQYYAHPTPQRASRTAPQRGQNFVQGQQVRIQAQGTMMILDAVVVRDASSHEQRVLVQIPGEPCPRHVLNDPRFIR